MSTMTCLIRAVKVKFMNLLVKNIVFNIKQTNIEGRKPFYTNYLPSLWIYKLLLDTKINCHCPKQIWEWSSLFRDRRWITYLLENIINLAVTKYFKTYYDLILQQGLPKSFWINWDCPLFEIPCNVRGQFR